MIKVIPKPFQKRDLVMRYLWKKMDGPISAGVSDSTKSTYLFVIRPTEHASFPENTRDLIRAKYRK